MRFRRPERRPPAPGRGLGPQAAALCLLGAAAGLAPRAAHAFPLSALSGSSASDSSASDAGTSGDAGTGSGGVGSANTGSTSTGSSPLGGGILGAGTMGGANFGGDQSALRHAIQAAAGAYNQPGATGNTAPAWIITPSLGLQEVFNDNLFATPTHRIADLLTVVTPGVIVTGDTPRVQMSLNYAPSLNYYARTTSQNAISQQLSLASTVTLVPDTFYVDIRGAAGVQPTLGGVPGISIGAPPSTGFGSTAASSQLGLASNQLSQFTSFGVSPYLVHRFGTAGTAKLGLSINQTSSTTVGGSGTDFLPFPTGTSNGSGDAASGHSLSFEEVAQFQTGEDLGRFQDLTLFDAYQSTGSGVSAAAHNATATNRLAYAINRRVAVFGELGVEQIHYSGTPNTDIHDIVWSIGTTLTPDPKSSITLGYGHQQGQNGVQFQGSYQLTARTSLTGSYTTGLATDLQQIQSQLNIAGMDQYGGFYNAATGGPLYIGNSLLGVQSNNLYQYKDLIFTATTQLDRDTLQASFEYTDNSLAALGTPGGIGYSQRGTTLSASWLHQLSELASLSVGVSYSVLQLTGFEGENGTDHVGAMNASWQYRLSKSVTLTAQYAFFDRSSTIATRSAWQNLLILGIT
ncbi:MAG: hypothetical protein KGL12_15825, partial [Rhodospirillales bacterium]|nr:hypothetical protein [Rhodospirillales bacterium]